MQLTLENLISFLEKEYPYDFDYSPQFELRQLFDGIDAFDLLETLMHQFDVSFESFDFRQYFLEEGELNTMTWKHLFQLEKQRVIKEELTIQMLFEFMQKHKGC